MLVERRSEQRSNTRVPIRARAQPSREKTLVDVRVVIVDDDSEARELLRRTLERHGAIVRSALTVRLALDMIEDMPPDIVVSDIGMPVEDGYDLIAELRAKTPGKGGMLPAIALTGFARSEDVRRTLAAGFQVHLAKPLDQDMLISSVVHLVDRRAPPSTRE